MASDAVSNELISKVVGYKITKGQFGNVTSNLPQRITIFGEANFANQGTVNFDEGYTLTTSQAAGETFGWGSPMHQIARILRPNSGSGIGGIPTIFYCQAQAAGATSKIIEIVSTGVSTANTTHTLIISGRTGLDGVNYDFTLNTGDTPAEINAKIQDAINNVLGCPGIAVATDYEVTFETKWKGLTANDVNITIDTNGNSAGINYAIATTQAGAATPSVQASLDTFNNDWNTVVVNSYGAVTSVMDALEAFNGIPDPTTPTGRYAAIIMKPFFAFTGSTLEDPSSITDTRLNDVTIVICPAPLSAGMPYEAAANDALDYAIQAQNNPHLDISGSSYKDMPTPLAIGAMDTYLNRDAIVKKGCSTVELIGGKYKSVDFVTSYHPIGETPPQFRYVRNLTIDFNIRYRYYLLEQLYVVDHVLAIDGAIVTASKVVKPSQWKQILFKFADDLERDGLIVDSQFMKDGMIVNIGTTNPDRFETFFPYKRPGFGRISSTTVEAGFNFNT